MEFKIYQFLLVGGGLFFILRSLIRYRNRKTGIAVLLFWVALGLGAIVMAFFPDQVSFPVAKWLGIENNVNAVIFLGLAILLISNYLSMQKINRLEEQMNLLVRQYAKENAQRPDAP